jgi:hypothetical protein
MKSAKLLDEIEQKLAERKVLKDIVLRLSDAIAIAPKQILHVNGTSYRQMEVDSGLLDLFQELHDLAN